MSLDEFAQQQREWANRAAEAQSKAAQAFARLLAIAERSDSGQARRIARFLAATYDSQAFTSFDPFDMRAVDVAISDDMLLCLDALRWGKADLHRLVPDGEQRLQAMYAAWGLTG